MNNPDKVNSSVLTVQLIVDIVRDYFHLPWFEINSDARKLIEKFLLENNTKTEDTSTIGDEALRVKLNENHLEPQFKLIRYNQRLNMAKHNQTDNSNGSYQSAVDVEQSGKSIIFFKCHTSQPSVTLKGKNYPEQNESAQIRWVTDDEAVKHLRQVLNDSSLESAGTILSAYQQLERFVDRKQVLDDLLTERREFMEKLLDYCESLLSIDEPQKEETESDGNYDSLSEADQNLARIGSELTKQSNKIVVLRSRQQQLKQIMANISVLFGGIGNFSEFKQNLLETVELLSSESDQLFVRWSAAVSSNIKYDLTRQCVIIEPHTHLPRITFSPHLEQFSKDAAQLRQYGFKIPADIEQIEQHVSRYVSLVRDLRTIVKFYMTVADQILLSQRPLLIEKAKQFTTMLESKQKLTWSDGVQTISAWINDLNRFMNAFIEENQHLRQLHSHVLETVKRMVDMSLARWPQSIGKVRRITEQIDQRYQNTLTWRKHWDYQLYKILEYYFNCLMIDGDNTIQNRESWTPRSSQRNQTVLARQQQILLFHSKSEMNKGDHSMSTSIELQFNPIGLVVFEPPMSTLKQFIFDRLQQFVTFPSTFTAFVDWSRDTSLNPRTDSNSIQVTRTLFHNIYYRNAKNFSHVYKKAFDAVQELITIRGQFQRWCSLYNMIKSIKSNRYLRADGEQNDTVNDKTEKSSDEFLFRTLEDYRHNLQQIKQIQARFSAEYSMVSEIRCQHSQYVINVMPIKMFIEWLLVEAESVLLELFRAQCDREMQNIETTCRNTIELMKRKPKTIDELLVVDTFFRQQLQSIHENLSVDAVTLREKIHFLQSWTRSSISTKSSLPSADNLPNLQSTDKLLDEFESVFKNGDNLLENYRDSIKSRISTQLNSTELEIEQILTRWNGLNDNLKRSPEVISNFQTNCNQVMENIDTVAKSCDYFQMEQPKAFGLMRQLTNEVEQLYGKFHLLYEFEQGMTPFMEMEWIVCRNKLAKIDQYIGEWLDGNEHVRSESMLQSHIEEWKNFIALLELCRGDFYQQLHWNQFLSQVLSLDKNFEDLKLADLYQRRNELAEKRSTILELNKRAFNDYSLREALNELNQFALNAKFVLYPYQTKQKRQVMLIKDWHQCFNQISDCFLLIQTVKTVDSAEISDEYLHAYEEWESKLVKLESLVTLLNAVQRKWISLEPIYQPTQAPSGGGQSTRDNGTNSFFNDITFSRFSNSFQEVLAIVSQHDAKLVQLLSVANLHNRLQLIDQNFSSTQKKLRTFIEESRQRFPRFYFLADEDLLLILSGKVDLNQSALVKKLFVNTIGRLVYRQEPSSSVGQKSKVNQSATIEAIESIQGEIVRLRKPISTDNTNGPIGIEQWLQTLDTEIKLTLKKIFARHLPDIRSIFEDVRLFATLPSQIFGVLGWIDFTEKIEDSIRKHGLNELKFDYERKLSLLTKSSFYSRLYETLLASYGNNELMSRGNSSTTRPQSRPQSTKAKSHNSNGGLEFLCKSRIKQAVLDVIHFISVIEILVQNQVRDLNHWLWQSQLRMYVRSNGADHRPMSDVQSEVDVRMGLACFEYSFEYLGSLGDSKLVHTELTNKCFLTLTQAMDLGLGGNPYGPAGTGKTESVKALGHHFGRQVLVFNCDEAIDVRSMIRILVGLIQCGSWGCFDEFNRLQLDVLSILSSQIQEIQNCIKNKSKYANISGYGQVSINSNAAIFITLNPVGKDYGGRNRIPDNLKSLFLPVSMTVPDIKVIVRFLLLAEGYSDQTAKILGEKITVWFDLAQGSMSRRKHYDWGLRAIKACLEASGRRLHAAIDNSKDSNIGSSAPELDNVTETELVIDTLRQQIKSKLVDVDAVKFDSLIETVFRSSAQSKKYVTTRQTSIDDNQMEQSNSTNIDTILDKAIRKVINEQNLIENDYQIEKIFQLYEQFQTRFGIVLIGPPGSGKTTVWNVLKKAFEYVSSGEKVDGWMQFHNVTVINPKSLNRAKLFGYVDEDTREWNDGLFSVKTREIVRDDSSGTMHWIVFDGDIDPDWVEALNSVLDDNRVLTLPSGERIDFDMNKCRILFETTSLAHASPATISRLGVVCIDTLMCNEMVQSFVAQNSLSLTALSAVNSHLDQLEEPINSGNLSMSTARTLLEHLYYCQSNHEDESVAFERISGSISVNEHEMFDGTIEPNSTSMIHSLVLTNSVRKCVQILRPLTGKHICLIGPVGSGKSSLATEILFANNGQLVAVDCTPSTEVSELTRQLLASCSIVHSGSGRTLRPTTGENLWIFVRHIELLSYDQWHSNSLLCFLTLLLKYHGFYHLETFDWINVDRFQIVLTCTQLSQIEPRLLTEMHVVRLEKPSLLEIEQILYAKTKLVDDNILKHFPSKYCQLVKLYLQESTTAEQMDIEMNYLKIGIEILDSLRHYCGEKNNSPTANEYEPIVQYEIYRTLYGYCDKTNLLTSLLEQENDKAASILYTSLSGSFRFAPIPLEALREQIGKWIRIYCNENDVPWTQWHLLPQTIRLVADLCSFMADSEAPDTSASTLPSPKVPTMVVVGQRGFGRKYLIKVVAHLFGYDKVWSPNSITSERHLTNELRSLLGSTEGEDEVGKKDDASKHRTQQKILLLLDEIHFEILAYLRDKVYGQIKSLIDANTVTVRLVLTTSEMSRLDHLMWLRHARLHNVFAMSQQDYHQLASKLISAQIESTDQLAVDIEDLCRELYAVYKHFVQPNQLSNVRFFIGFVQSFTRLFNKQHRALHNEQEHLKGGVDKLDQVASQVRTLKDDALNQKQLLDTKRAEADEAFNLIMNSMHQSEDKKVELEDVQKRIEVETANLKDRKAVIDKELEQIEPTLQSAKAAVGGIRSDALSEIRSLRAPPEVIRDILEGVLRLMGVNDTSWISMKTFLSRRGVKEEIMNFDCHKITPEIRSKVEQLLVKRKESFQPAVAKRASAAAALLAEWVKANVEYSRVLHKIGPLETELKKLETGLVRAQSRLKTLNMQLEGVDTEVGALRSRMQAVTVEAAQIEINLKNSTKVLEQSETLVTDLSAEHERWKRKLETIQRERDVQAHKCLITVGYAFCASWEASYSKRSNLLRQCFQDLSIEMFDLNEFVSVSGEEELFLHHLSTTTTAASDPQVQSTFPISLICDPAHKALQHFESYETTSLTAHDWLKVLELCIRFGRTLLITNFSQLDIRLLPLLTGQVYGSKETRHWTFIGERKVDYNPRFSLHLVTDAIDANHSIASRTMTLFRVVNLSPSFGSLSTQLLRHIINVKRPELEQQMEQVERGVRELQKQLKQLESELLEKFAQDNSENLLENVALIEQLKYLKRSAVKVERSLQESDKLREDLDKERLQYKQISHFAAELFFSVANMPELCPMYFFGYQEFEQLFKRTLEQNLKTLTNETLCFVFFRYVSQALFAEHRRTLRTYFTTRFTNESARISAISADISDSIGQFLTDLNSQNAAFKLALIITAQGSDPSTEIENVVVNQLKYELETISMGSEVTGQVTTLLLPQQQKGPITWSKSNKSNMKNEKSRNKSALCLSNLHLVNGWLPQLAQILQQLDTSQRTDNNIELIVLVSEVSDQFPVNLLEMCTKFAYETAPGLSAQLRRLGNTMTDLVQHKQLDRNDPQSGTFTMLQYFHVICCERRLYTPFGWTKNYEFGFNEFRFGVRVLSKLLAVNTRETSRPQADVLRGQLFDYILGLFGEVIYGGKVDRSVDQTVLMLLLKRCFDSNSSSSTKNDYRMPYSTGINDIMQNMSTDEMTIDFRLLGLPLNADSFRNQLLEEKLRNNLKLLLMEGGSEGDQNPSRSEISPSKFALQPSGGVPYYRKLWKRILAKCKVNANSDLDKESNDSSWDILQTATTWNELVVGFVQSEMEFAKQVMTKVEADLNGNQQQESDIDSYLVKNETPPKWLDIWLDGVSVAQDFLITLARIYMRLASYNFADSESNIIPFDLTACFHPKLFLNTLKQFAAKQLETCVDELGFDHQWETTGVNADSNTTITIKTSFDEQEEQIKANDGRSIVAKLTGIWIEGALYDKDRLEPCSAESVFCSSMPVLTITITPWKNGTSDKVEPQTTVTVNSATGNAWLPLYSTSKRHTILEQWPVKCAAGTENKWLEMGVALVLDTWPPKSANNNQNQTAES